MAGNRDRRRQTEGGRRHEAEPAEIGEVPDREDAQDPLRLGRAETRRHQVRRDAPASKIRVHGERAQQDPGFG